MKILVISDKVYPDEYGGSCTVTYELIKEWQEVNDVQLFTCKKTKSTDDTLFKGIVYRYFNKVNLYKTVKNLMMILRNAEYDIIITHSVFAWFILYLTSFFYRSCRSEAAQFTVFHGPWHKEAYFKYAGKKSFIKQFLIPKVMLLIEKLYCKKNQNYIFLSEYMKDQLKLIDPSIEKKTINYIPGGVRLENFSRKYDKADAKALLNINADKIVLFTLRRLDKRMGIDRVIDALKLMSNEERNKYLLIIGGCGAYKSILQKNAEDIADNVLFTDFIPDQELNKYFCATDLFLVPTLDLEGFGLVNLESLAMGVPVLATPQGGMIELSRNLKYFHLTEENTTESLKYGILRYGEEYKNILVNEILTRYEWSVIAKQYLTIFKRFI